MKFASSAWRVYRSHCLDSVFVDAGNWGRWVSDSEGIEKEEEEEKEEVDSEPRVHFWSRLASRYAHNLFT